MRQLYNLLINILLSIFALAAYGTEVPRIINFTKSQHQASDQCWDIQQAADYRIFIGSSSGLLLYDGVHWQNLVLPNQEIVRALHVDRSGRVFTGGFAAVGYWQSDAWGDWQYTSLAEGIEDFENEEIWHFVEWNGSILFQSFSRLYRYDYHSVQSISIPGNIMFASVINDRLILPVIDSGLYISNDNYDFEKINGSDLFAGMRVAGILPFDNENSWLICTQNEGIYRYADGKFSAWNVEVNDELSAYQFNKASRLKNGNYAFGTILNGMYVTDPKCRILYHFNRENGLQNNTVLSILEDEMQNIWVGMDRGIDLVDITSPLRFFHQKSGGIGAVYTATIYKDRLYAGTNQGLFHKSWPSRQEENFQLLEGTQGQVWDLKVIDGQLLAAHNTGLFMLKEGVPDFLFEQTGCYQLQKHPERKDLILAGTYTGIITLKKSASHAWKFGGELKDYQHPSKKILIDKAGTIWAVHPHRGLAKITADSTYSSALEIKLFGKNEGLPAHSTTDISIWDQQILIHADSTFLQYSTSENIFRPVAHVEKLPFSAGSYHMIQGRGVEWFEVYSDLVVWHAENKENSKISTQKLYVSLLSRNENIISLNDSLYLFCLEDGYAIFNSLQLAPSNNSARLQPLLVKIDGLNRQLGQSGADKKYLLSGKWIRFTFTVPQFNRNVKLQYRLNGFEQQWSPYRNNYSCEYTNLPPGPYQLQLRAADSPETTTFDFTILPEWYQSWWANLLLVFLLITLGGLLLKWHYFRLNRQIRKLKLEKSRELQRQQMKTRNERLHSEIQLRSRQLADSTMNLVRKNEMLMQIKEELGSIEKQSEQARAIKKLSRSIDHQLTNEEDWKIFENYFNELHEQFFKRLKSSYPELTPGDLRLAAYLKMNLTSKELAPLLNISLRGVENKRYRLRRKLGLDQDANLTDFLIKY